MTPRKDTLGRRLRGHRQSTGKRIDLQARDLEFLRCLYTTARYMRSSFLFEFTKHLPHSANQKKCVERLGLLFNEANTSFGGQYLAWPPEQDISKFDKNYYPGIFELDKAGKACCEPYGIEPDYSDLIARGRKGGQSTEFPHSMMIADALASIRLGVMRDHAVRFISLKEIMATAPEATRKLPNPYAVPVDLSYQFPNGKTETLSTAVTPDALFGFEFFNAYGESVKKVYYWHEAEHTNQVRCNNLKKTSFLKKLLALRNITATQKFRTHFGIDNLFALVTAPTEDHVNTMIDLTMEISDRRGNNYILYKAIPVVGESFITFPATAWMFDEPYRRAGHDPLYINRVHKPTRVESDLTLKEALDGVIKETVAP